MIGLVRTLLSPLLSLILMNLACGMFNTFVSVRLDMQGYTSETIGLVSSALYGGVLLGSLMLGKWIARVGHIWAFAAFCAVSAALTLLHAFWVDPLYWSFLRVLSGVCLAGVFIVVESWCLLQSPPDKQASSLSLYLVIFYLALSGGQLLLNFSSLTSKTPYYMVAALLGSSILPFKFLPSKAPQKVENPPSRMAISQIFSHSPIGFFGGVVSGIVLGSLYGLMPVYGAALGLNVFQIGTLMSVLIFGGLSFQWPMGAWADKKGRRKALAFASLGSFLLALVIATAGAVPYPVLLILILVFGGHAFTIYPLSMAYLCEKLQPEEIVPATGGFVLCYACGALTGPLLAPLTMSWLGPSGLFYFLGLISLFLGSCCTLGRKITK